MDAIIMALIAAAPQLGVGGVLLALLGLSLKWQAQERGDTRTSTAALSVRHDNELRRLMGAHDAELADLRGEIKGLREQLSDVNRKLDDERERRRAAEDRTPRQERAIAEFDQLRAEYDMQHRAEQQAQHRRNNTEYQEPEQQRGPWSQPQESPWRQP